MNRRTFALFAVSAPLACRAADAPRQRAFSRAAQLGRRMAASHLGILAGIGAVVGVAAVWHQVRGTGRPEKPWERRAAQPPAAKPHDDHPTLTS